MNNGKQQVFWQFKIEYCLSPLNGKPTLKWLRLNIINLLHTCQLKKKDHTVKFSFKNILNLDGDIRHPINSSV